MTEKEKEIILFAIQLIEGEHLANRNVDFTAAHALILAGFEVDIPPETLREALQLGLIEVKRFLLDKNADKEFFLTKKGEIEEALTKY